MASLRRGRVTHVVPGRVRIRIDRRALSGASGTQLRAALLALPGILDVRTASQTGSVVIFHDPAALDVSGLIALARTARLLAIDALDADPYAGSRRPMSETARGIHQTFHGVDVRLAELTKGRWDLRSVVPFALGAFALRQMLSDFSVVSSAPWYVLAWYAFDSFWKLNQGQEDPARVTSVAGHDLDRDADGE